MLRRPFAVTQALKQLPSASKTVLRNFHTEQPKQSIFKGFKSSSESSRFASARNVFQQTFRRNYQGQASVGNPLQSGDFKQRLLYGAGIFGGTVLAINLIFNRETREDGGMPPFERKYLNDTFLHTGLGIGIIGIAARTLHANGWSYRLMSASPWLVLGVGLVGSIGMMMGTRMTPPEKYVYLHRRFGNDY